MKTFLSFKISDNDFIIPISNIKEVIDLPTITKIPKQDEFLGVTNLRGESVPILDLRKKLGYQELEKSGEVIIITFDNKLFGFLVDNVYDVIELDVSDKSKGYKFINGLVNTGDKFLIYLNVGNIINTI